MREELDLVAEIRDDTGKGASRRLRRDGKVPAILYGGGLEPRLLALEHNKVVQQLGAEAFYSSVLTIKAGDRTQQAILKDVQRHPARAQILHLDLQRVVEDEEIRMNVPIHFLNEDKAKGVKLGGGVVSHLMSDVEVTCLPKDLPEYLDIDVAELDVDEMLHLSDLKPPPGVEIVELASGAGHDHPIVLIHIPRAEVEEPVEAEELEAGEVPIVGEEEKVEGEEDKDKGKDKD